MRARGGDGRGVQGVEFSLLQRAPCCGLLGIQTNILILSYLLYSPISKNHKGRGAMRIPAALTLAIWASAANPALARDMLVADQAQFGAAVKEAEAGDTIILADGEWRDFQIVFTGNGSAAKPITLTAQTKGKVLITGRSNLHIGGRHLLVSGLVFKNGASPTDAVISFRRDSGMLASDSRVTEVVIDGYSKRSEERRGGQECVSTCRSRWSPYY